MSKTPRTPLIQTPGAEAETDQNDGAAGGAPEGSALAQLPPDMQALVQQAVAEQLAQQKATTAAAQTVAGQELPTQEEALKLVQADPKRRSILSKDGWVAVEAPVKGRDAAGFAKD